VSGWGKPVSLGKPDAKPWSATVEFITGQPSELVLARVDMPTKVMVGEAELVRQEGAGQAGWSYNAQHKTLVIRFRQAEPKTSVSVEW
jgi:hypothetical protein